MKDLGSSSFTGWDVSLGSGNIYVTGKWVEKPTAAVELREHPEGGYMERTLILHLEVKTDGKESAQVSFQTKADVDTFNVVAIQFPDGQFERIYLPNYELKDEPE